VKKAIADAEASQNEEQQYVAPASSDGSAEPVKNARKNNLRTKAGYVMGSGEVSDNLFRQVDLVAPPISA
jgi:two-component system response regulator HydG